MTTPAELRTRRDHQGEELHQIGQKIETRLEELTHWENFVQKKPLQSLGIAIGVGFILSGAASPILRATYQQASSTAKAGIATYLSALMRDAFRVSPSKYY